ncbi:MAG: hypothetical protein VKK59_00750 [Vampirovibrionales bacterium]|nr:hypothetical protein [Vampirovibrionales bacterium]
MKRIEKTEKANITALEKHVRELAKLDRSFENPSGLDQAARYIKKEWEALGFKVREQTFTVQGKQYKNLMISIGPASREKLIVGAHYDVCAH